MGGFPWDGTKSAAPNRKKPVKRLKQQKDKNVKPKKSVKMFTKFVEPGAPMRNKRFALREGASVSVRKFFSGKNYQLRLAMAIDMFVDNCLPPVKDRSDPRLKKALREAKQMYRVHCPNHRWITKGTTNFNRIFTGPGKLTTPKEPFKKTKGHRGRG
jgi:hypothetical protein